MDRNELIFALALATLALALAWGLWQFFSVRRSQAKRGQAPGVASATEEMLHHRERGSPLDGELPPVEIARSPRTPRTPD